MFLFTMDNCCNKRAFVTGNNNVGESPLFPTLARETAEAEVKVDPLQINPHQEEQFAQKKRVAAPLNDPVNLLRKTRPKKSSMASLSNAKTMDGMQQVLILSG
jgi:hypothetical protein